MKSVEESVVTAMDGADVEIFPYLPYILQDIWEIGTDPNIIIRLIRKHTDQYSNRTILDLGCGKGAVSIQLAKEFSCKCLGIDAIKEFIDEAQRKAIEYQVDTHCTFEVDDIRHRVNSLPRFDIIILGAIGPVFGNYSQTLDTLTKCLHDNGIILIDDGYIENDSVFTHPLILKQNEILQQTHKVGMQLIDEVIAAKEDIKDSDEILFGKLKKRCLELGKKYPNKKKVFDDYIKKQQKENDILETKAICSTMVIKRKIP